MGRSAQKFVLTARVQRRRLSHNARRDHLFELIASQTHELFDVPGGEVRELMSPKVVRELELLGKKQFGGGSDLRIGALRERSWSQREVKCFLGVFNFPVDQNL